MKRILAVLLSVSLLCTPVFSTYVSAAETDFPTQQVELSEFVLSNRCVIATADGQYVLTTTAGTEGNLEYSWLEVDTSAGSSTVSLILAPWGKGVNTNQKWAIVSAENTNFPNALKIISPVNLQGVSLETASMKDGVEALPKDYYGQTSQMFEIEKTDDGYYHIKNALTGMYLGVKDGQVEAGAHIAQYKDGDAMSQKWMIYKIEDETASRLTVTQTGWTPKASKRIAFSSNTELSENPILTVTKDGQEVLSVEMTPPANAAFNLYAYGADVTALEEVGEYEASVNIDGIAPVSFFIAEDVYRNVRGVDQNDVSVEANMTIQDITEHFFQWQRCDESDVVPMDQFVQGKDPGSGKIYGEDYNLPIYVAENKAPEGGGEAHKVDSGEVLADVFGGYIDATSTDKETGNNAKAAISLLHAYKYASDPADKEAILDEIFWVCDYLLKIQKDNGSFYLAVKPYDIWMQDSPPRHVVDLEGTGLACRVGSALAEAAILLEEIDPERSEKYLAAAIKAWEYYEANPENFIDRGAYPVYWTGNAGSILALAVQLYIATGETKYQIVADSMIEDGEFIGGVFTKLDGEFPGQLNSYLDEADHGQALEAIAAYYPYCNASTKEKIDVLVDEWITYWTIKSTNAYGYDMGIPKTYFGCCGWTMQIVEKAALLALATNNKECLDLATNFYDFVTGNNPTGSSFIVGFGTLQGCEPFGRTRDVTMGAVLPGLFVNEDTGYLTSREIDGSIFWKMGETTIDVASCVTSSIAMLDYAFTTQYDDIASGAEVETIGNPEENPSQSTESSDNENTSSTGDLTDSSEEEVAPASSDNTAAIVAIIVAVVIVVAAAMIVVFVKKKGKKQ